ncbi:MAG: hypothetical protein SXA11_04955 [Cyanobacteriota bacterium]|nr:hypothetical protein [Cyanobacteriota bacterium]
MKSEPNNYLLAPNIYLFAYQLRDGLAEGKTNSFWQKSDKLLSQFTTETLTQYLDFSPAESSDRAILLDGKDALYFSLSDSPEISGSVQPLQIQDSYGLFFNIGYDDEVESLEEVELKELGKFNPDGVLHLPESDNLLGQTLLITGYLPNPNKQRDLANMQRVANNCYEGLLGNNPPPLYRYGELFGSSIFEYGNPNKIGRQTNNYCHVIIWLFRDEGADKQANKCLNDIVNLLFYRAKMVKGFSDRRLVYQQLDREYAQIEKNLDDLQKQLDTRDASTNERYLKDFQTQLKNLARDSLAYTRLLRKMEDFGNTIEINLFNYKETIEQICDKLETDKEELSFLKYFGEETAPHFYRQIQADLGYFEHGTDLISQAIASIRGIVEIDRAESDRLREEREKQQEEERAKRDRDLEDQVQAVGVGIAAGAIFASTSGLITQPWTLPSSDRPVLWPHPFIIAFVGSIFFSWAGWWVAWKAIERRRSGRS